MINLREIQEILSNNHPEHIEGLAQRAQQITRQYFGRTISLYAPLYLSNYCGSLCTYCGFNSHNKIKRFKLSEKEMHKEMLFISGQGVENILLLTGESYKATPISYLKQAVTIASQYFPSISLEIQPMDENEYKELFISGADGVTIYQETYDKTVYKNVHLSGKKTDYEFRYNTPERAAKAGFRYISLGILLGLAEISNDLFELYKHLKYMEKYYPGVEYSISFPRFQTIKGKNFSEYTVNDATFIKAICLTRILFPRVGINLSTRETPELRDNTLELGVTRISAGSNTAVGGYSLKKGEEQDPQFDIGDTRSFREVINLLKQKNFDPVLTDWRRIKNEVI